MGNDLNLSELKRQQLTSLVLTLNREKSRLNDELLRFKLLCNCYEKLLNVSKQNCDHCCNREEFSELSDQLFALKDIKLCYVQLNRCEYIAGIVNV